MKRRHALLVGFALGALAVIALVALAGSGSLRPQTRSVAGSENPSPSPSLIPSPQAKASPSEMPATGGATAYDPENHGVILFGGTIGGGSSDETWLWDRKAWTRLDVPAPPARSAEMITYDSVRHQLVMFGGSGPAGAGQALLFQDTWTWDGRKSIPPTGRILG